MHYGNLALDREAEAAPVQRRYWRPALLVLLVALIWVAWRWGVAEDRMEMLEKQAAAGFLQAPSSNRRVRVDLRAPQARLDRRR